MGQISGIFFDVKQQWAIWNIRKIVRMRDRMAGQRGKSHMTKGNTQVIEERNGLTGHK